MERSLLSSLQRYARERDVEIECRRKIRTLREFSSVNNFLRLRLWEDRKRETSFTRVEIHPEGVRVNDSTDVMRKNQLSVEVFGEWKVVVSTERGLRDKPRGKPLFTRHKLRESYRDEGLRIDMTTVTVEEPSRVERSGRSANDSRVFYEMELEVINGNGEEPRKMVEMILLYMGWAESVLHATPLQNPRLNVVRNLKPRMLLDPTSPNYLNEFILTPKWDGVRYFLHINQGEAFLSNATSTLDARFVFTQNIDIPHEISLVLDGEVYRREFIAFDLVVLNKEEVAGTLGRMDRVRLMQEVVEKYDLPVRLADFCDEGAKTLALREYSRRFRGEDMDGFLVIERDSLYNNVRTFKFKPIHQLTIDFRPKQRVDPGGLVFYELYCSGPDRKDVLFKGTGAYPFDGMVKKLLRSERGLLAKPDSVVEFRWFCGRFVPVRYRGDKKYPNYIDICRDVWEDINDPFTFSSFKQALFKRDYPGVSVVIEGICQRDRLLDRDTAMDMWLESVEEAQKDKLPPNLQDFLDKFPRE